jgi:hypothetical protein
MKGGPVLFNDAQENGLRKWSRTEDPLFAKRTPMAAPATRGPYENFRIRSQNADSAGGAGPAMQTFGELAQQGQSRQPSSGSAGQSRTFNPISSQQPTRNAPPISFGMASQPQTYNPMANRPPAKSRLIDFISTSNLKAANATSSQQPGGGIFASTSQPQTSNAIPRTQPPPSRPPVLSSSTAQFNSIFADPKPQSGRDPSVSIFPTDKNFKSSQQKAPSTLGLNFSDLTGQSSTVKQIRANLFSQVVNSNRSAALERDLFSDLPLKSSRAFGPRGESPAALVTPKPTPDPLLPAGLKAAAWSSARRPSFKEIVPPISLTSDYMPLDGSNSSAARGPNQPAAGFGVGPRFGGATAPESEVQRETLRFMRASARRFAAVEGYDPVGHIQSQAMASELDRKKTVSSNDWASASREKWTIVEEEEGPVVVEMSLEQRVEMEFAAEQEQRKKAKSAEDEDEDEDEFSKEERRKKKRKEYRAMKGRMRSANFKTDVNEMALYVPKKGKVEAPVEVKVQKELYIPPSISVANFASMMKIPLRTHISNVTDHRTLTEKVGVTRSGGARTRVRLW